MMLKESLIFFVAFLVVLCNPTKVYNCLTSKIVDDYAKISNCQNPPCVLKKPANVTIEQNIVPHNEISHLKTSAYLRYRGSNFPFPEVNGKSACEQIYHMDGSKAPCPLKNGSQYVYKNSFFIPDMEYTSALAEIEWVLQEVNTRITCFQLALWIMNK